MKNIGFFSKPQVLRLRRAFAAIQLMDSEGFHREVAMPEDVVEILLRCGSVHLGWSPACAPWNDCFSVLPFRECVHSAPRNLTRADSHLPLPSIYRHPRPPAGKNRQTICRRRSPSGLLGIRIQEWPSPGKRNTFLTITRAFFSSVVLSERVENNNIRGLHMLTSESGLSLAYVWVNGFHAFPEPVPLTSTTSLQICMKQVMTSFLDQEGTWHVGVEKVVSSITSNTPTQLLRCREEVDFRAACWLVIFVRYVILVFVRYVILRPAKSERYYCTCCWRHLPLVASAIWDRR